MRHAWLVLVLGCGSSGSRSPDAAPIEVDAPLLVGEDVVTGITDPSTLAVDATHVYFVHQGGNISRVGKTGRTINAIATAQRGPTSLDATTDRLCWVSTGTHAQDFLDGSIRCAPKSGGTDQQLATSFFPSALAIDGDTIYWVEIDGQRVKKVGMNGTGEQILDTSPTAKTHIAISSTKLAWVASGAEADVVAMDRTTGVKQPLSMEEYSPRGVVIDGDDVFWLVQHSLSDYGALRVSRAGGAPGNLVVDEYYPSSLLKTGGSLYWISNTRIRGMGLGGATAAVTLATLDSISGFATDGEYLYWSEPDRGAIVRMRL